MEMNHNGNKLMKNPVGTGVWLPLGMKGQLIFSTRGAYDEEREESAFFEDGGYDCHRGAGCLYDCPGGGDTGCAGRR
ncbi:MAG: hypothetical protein ACLUAK_05700 [Dialister invisus]|jgi:hypothetical protein|uniref:hypothetical protein n=1 Tax=Dialister invisus TaxID=218538 RepID=UPI0002FCF435|nr:hypothetical protein [Dialister invisus]